MNLPGSRFSLPVKLTALAIATQGATVVLLVWIAGATTSVPLRAIGFALALSPPIFLIFFLGRYLIGRLTRPVMAAYDRLASGDFAAQLPPMTTGADFVGLRDAFAEMAGALGRSVQRLRDADIERRRLFSDLAHELATPTSTLLGISHALRADNEDRERLLTLLEGESTRLERLIADVRDLAQIEDPALSMVRESCDIASLATLAVERARVTAPDVAVAIEAVPSPAYVDPIRIDQIFTNLIDNACRHATGGRVAVHVRPTGDAIEIAVEDSGTGVPTELLPQLGRRLVRLDPSRARDTGGHGLGLAIVRAIVERHGGRVEFGRAELGGLRVAIHLDRDTVTTV